MPHAAASIFRVDDTTQDGLYDSARNRHDVLCCCVTGPLVSTCFEKEMDDLDCST